MRGKKLEQVNVAYLLNVETMILPGHPIRAIRRMLVEMLAEMDEHVEEMYAQKGARLRFLSALRDI